MIKKAVIPCAGRGTRFLPITKALPKEILPIIDTPVLQYIVDELYTSGISEVCIVISPEKEVIRRYFEPDSELEDALAAAGKTEELFRLKKIIQNVDVSFVYQEKPIGSADAVSKAKSFVGKEAFALCLGDDIVVSETPATLQLIREYDKTGSTIVGVQEIETDDITKYGVICPGRIADKLIECKGIIEKPSIKNLPSRYACLGRYILTSDFFDTLSYITPSVNGEFALTDSLNIMSQKGIYAYDFEGKRYDMGNKLDALKATVDFTLKDEMLGKEFREYLLNIITK